MLRRTSERVVETAPVDVIAAGATVHGVSQDLSAGGLFLRTEEFLPVGTPVELVLYVHEPPLRLPATVVHALPSDEARALGRTGGMGFAFGDIPVESRDILERQVARLSARQTLPPPAPNGLLRAVVADGETRLLERLSSSLGRAGFDVVIASNGLEAYAACLERPPDVVIADLDLPVFDTSQLLENLGARPELADVPVLVMSEDCGDLRRLQAYQLGVQDFLPKPFTVVELCIRARRLALQHSRRDQRVVLRGEIAKVALSTLLTMFAHEQQSGVLTVTAGEDVTWLALRGGQVVTAHALGANASSRDTLMRVLGWTQGQFELTACEVQAPDEVGMSTIQILMEHARQLDELAYVRAGGVLEEA